MFDCKTELGQSSAQKGDSATFYMLILTAPFITVFEHNSTTEVISPGAHQKLSKDQQRAYTKRENYLQQNTLQRLAQLQNYGVAIAIVAPNFSGNFMKSAVIDLNQEFSTNLKFDKFFIFMDYAKYASVHGRDQHVLEQAIKKKGEAYVRGRLYKTLVAKVAAEKKVKLKDRSHLLILDENFNDSAFTEDVRKVIDPNGPTVALEVPLAAVVKDELGECYREPLWKFLSRVKGQGLGESAEEAKQGHDSYEDTDDIIQEGHLTAQRASSSCYYSKVSGCGLFFGVSVGCASYALIEAYANDATKNMLDAVPHGQEGVAVAAGVAALLICLCVAYACRAPARVASEEDTPLVRGNSHNSL